MAGGGLLGRGHDLDRLRHGRGLRLGRGLGGVAGNADSPENPENVPVTMWPVAVCLAGATTSTGSGTAGASGSGVACGGRGERLLPGESGDVPVTMWPVAV